LSESVDVKLKREQSKFGEAIPLREGVEKGTLVKALKMFCMPFLEGVRLKHKSFVSPLITHPHSWITKLMLQSFDDYGELAESNNEREVILEARALFEGMKCIVFISTFEIFPPIAHTSEYLCVVDLVDFFLNFFSWLDQRRIGEQTKMLVQKNLLFYWNSTNSFIYKTCLSMEKNGRQKLLERKMEK
jgi:hypothetical protein